MALVEEGIVWLTFYLFVGSAALAAVFGILVLLFVTVTPARTWLRAKFKHRPIIAARRRDRKIDYHIADKYEQGIVTSNEYGSFLVDEDSVYLSKKGGVSVLPVNAEIGITLSPKVLEMIDGLKGMGYDNIVEAEKANAVWGKCSCGYEGELIPIKISDSEEEDNYTLMCPNDYKEVYDEQRAIEQAKGIPKDDKAQDGEDGHADKVAVSDAQLPGPAEVL